MYGVVERLSRLRDLLHIHAATREEVAAHLPDAYPLNAGGRKRLQRDLDALRRLGYEIEYDHTSHAYRLGSGPVALDLTDEEVRALALIREAFTSDAPYTSAVQALLGKLESHLSEPVRRQYHRKAPLALSLKLAADYAPCEPVIRVLEEAIDAHRAVRFEYQPIGRDRSVVHSRVDPLEIQYLDRHLYLLGFSHKMQHVYEYRLERILPDSLQILPSRVAGPHRRPILRFRYRLAEPIARFGVSERFLDQQVEYLPNGDVLVSAGGYSEFRIIREMLRYGDQAEILEPPRLRARMAEMAGKVAAQYAGPPDFPSSGGDDLV